MTDNLAPNLPQPAQTDIRYELEDIYIYIYIYVCCSALCFIWFMARRSAPLSVADSDWKHGEDEARALGLLRHWAVVAETRACRAVLSSQNLIAVAVVSISCTMMGLQVSHSNGSVAIELCLPSLSTVVRPRLQ